jgi:alkylation response protein AidB-like acyl-CoA dehydrogenase
LRSGCRLVDGAHNKGTGSRGPGEKWLISAGRVAGLLFVMCVNGMFVVPRAAEKYAARRSAVARMGIAVLCWADA